jgi:plasmid maintenance system antidote protein VapI
MDEPILIGEHLRDALEARGWSTAELARRMGGDDPKLDQLAVELLINAPNPAVFMDTDTARRMERAFGLSDGFLTRLDQLCRHQAGWQVSIEDARKGGPHLAEL